MGAASLAPVSYTHLVIPAIGRKAGEVLDFGGLLGYGPIMPVNSHDPSVLSLIHI